MKRFKEILISIGLIILVFCINYFLPYVVILPFYNKINDLSYVSKSIILLVAQIVTVGTIALIFINPLIEDFKKFRFSKLGTGFAIYVFGMGGMIFFNIMLAIFLPTSVSDNEALNREMIAKMPIYAVPTIVLFGPILEELLFRFSFRNLFKKQVPFILITATIFASAHLIASFDSFSDIFSNLSDLLYFFPYFCLALAFSTAYAKTKNIFTSILVHIGHNAVCVFFIALSALLGVL